MPENNLIQEAQRDDWHGQIVRRPYHYSFEENMRNSLELQPKIVEEHRQYLLENMKLYNELYAFFDGRKW